MLDNTNMGGGDGRPKYSHILHCGDRLPDLSVNSNAANSRKTS